jgi:pimeloyl-ACP methyl ester carboxylesterase
MTKPLETRYARNGDIHLAYQVIGSGAMDLVLVPGLIAHLEVQWDQDPRYRSWVRRLASFSRLILFDTRGSGLSKDCAFDMQGFRNVLALRAEIEGQWGGKAPDPARFIDLSLYNRALGHARP